MLNGMSNPLGGGQAYVVDDFTFTGVPEPATLCARRVWRDRRIGILPASLDETYVAVEAVLKPQPFEGMSV